jgi:hypothetical protein
MAPARPIAIFQRHALIIQTSDHHDGNVAVLMFTVSLHQKLG